MSEAPHIPVMIDNVLAALEPKDGAVYVDGTFGAGGYTKAFLDAADCTVIAIDRDQTAIENGAALKDQYGDRLVLTHGRFSDALELARNAGFEFIDGFILDVGVSSMQLDQAERGFSFRFNGPLDMRMDQNSDGQSAADLVNELPEEDLANLIYRFGDERKSRRIAKEIVKQRAEERIETTGRLASIIRSVVPKSKKDSIDPATRTFQALRIAVNSEISEINKALCAAETLLKPGGKLIVVSFHSLEDTPVKKFMRARAGQESKGSRHLPHIEAEDNWTFTLPSKKALFPSEDEANTNPRARSARMRVAIRTDSPPWNTDTSTEINAGGYG